MKILCIGNSYSYYWTDELSEMLRASGYEDAKVCNLYYSGCTFEWHWDWYVNGELKQEFFTAANGDKTVEKPTGLEHALSVDNWDIVSFQQSNRYGTVSMRESIKAHLPQLYNLVKTRHPNAKFYWQQNWAHEVDQGNGRGETSEESQVARTDAFRVIAKEVCEEYGFTNIPLGEAWEAIRHDPIFYEKGEGETPIRSMHTRIMHAGKMKGEIINSDFSHDGDVGGGQYLNACVWFEVLFGKSCVGNTFRPKYALSEELISTLQQAAHQAVADMDTK
jgi:hypothetical protein